MFPKLFLFLPLFSFSSKLDSLFVLKLLSIALLFEDFFLLLSGLLEYISLSFIFLTIFFNFLSSLEIRTSVETIWLILSNFNLFFIFFIYFFLLLWTLKSTSTGIIVSLFSLSLTISLSLSLFSSISISISSSLSNVIIWFRFKVLLWLWRLLIIDLFEYLTVGSLNETFLFLGDTLYNKFECFLSGLLNNKFECFLSGLLNFMLLFNWFWKRFLWFLLLLFCSRLNVLFL